LSEALFFEVKLIIEEGLKLVLANDVFLNPFADDFLIGFNISEIKVEGC
jgi:hypothetical protein